MTAVKAKINYDLIEPGWRAGLLSHRQLADNYTKETGIPVSYAAIVKHFNQKNIPREPKIVADKLAIQLPEPPPTELDLKVAEKIAMNIATVQINQCHDIHRFRKLCLTMMDELEDVTKDNEIFNELGILLRSEDEKGQDKRNDIYNKVISQSSRISSLSSLSYTLKTLIELERKVYRIDDIDEARQPSTTINNNNIQINSDQIAMVIDGLQQKY